jgi:hypothetical protein
MIQDTLLPAIWKRRAGANSTLFAARGALRWVSDPSDLSKGMAANDRPEQKY